MQVTVTISLSLNTSISLHLKQRKIENSRSLKTKFSNFPANNIPLHSIIAHFVAFEQYFKKNIQILLCVSNYCHLHNLFWKTDQ